MKVRRHFQPAFEISWFKLLTSCCVDDCCCFQYSWNLNFHDEALNVHKFLSKCVSQSVSKIHDQQVMVSQLVKKNKQWNLTFYPNVDLNDFISYSFRYL